MEITTSKALKQDAGCSALRWSFLSRAGITVIAGLGTKEGFEWGREEIGTWVIGFCLVI